MRKKPCGRNFVRGLIFYTVRSGCIMFKKLLACMLLVMLTASGAWAALDLWTSHQSIASLTDGHADYSGARFLELWVGLGDSSTTATASDVNNPGTLTLSGGNYSY